MTSVYLKLCNFFIFKEPLHPSVAGSIDGMNRQIYLQGIDLCDILALKFSSGDFTTSSDLPQISRGKGVGVQFVTSTKTPTRPNLSSNMPLPLITSLNLLKVSCMGTHTLTI